MTMTLADSTFRINSINPWRMLLFGSLGVLIPITIYILLLEFRGKALLTDYSQMIDLLFIPVLLFSILGGYIGFKYSAFLVTININNEGLSESIKPGLFFLSERKKNFQWREIISYSLTEDTRGKILEINLQNNRKISIGTANVLNNSDNFDSFYYTFLNYADNINKTQRERKSSGKLIFKSNGFYQRKSVKILAFTLLIMMVIILFLFISYGNIHDIWEWLRLLFFELLGGAFVWRTLFSKS